MSPEKPRLALLTPHGVDATSADMLAGALDAACAAGDVAAVILRLAEGDERSLVNLVKRLAPPVQEHGAAVLIEVAGKGIDPVAVASRGGADGVHLPRPDIATLRALRERLRDGRMLGCGGVLGSRHVAMEAGETGIDYLLFGGVFQDGGKPDPEEVVDRAGWWAEIFQTPCIAAATQEQDVEELVGTGAEFVALESGLWLEDPGAVGRAQAIVDAAGEGP